MKSRLRSFLVLVMVVFSVGLTRSAHAYELGLGPMVGEPIGATGKYWLDSKRALDFGAGYSWQGPNGVQLHASYLLHESGMIQIDQSHWLDLYYGAGPRLKFADDPEGDVHFGVRVPVGLTYQIKAETPMDVFAELAPILDFTPELDVWLNFTVGMRFYFTP